MIAIVTDAHYRMSVALIRDLAEAGVQVIACEQPQFAKPLGFASRAAWQCYQLPAGDVAEALLGLCREVSARCGELPALLPVGAKTLAAIAARRAEFDAVCGLCIPTAQQLALLNDKAALHVLAQQCSVAVPQEYAPEVGESIQHFSARVPLPCAVKPVCGEQFGLSAAQRYAIVRTARELEDAYARFYALTDSAPIVQQLLPGAGLGCSVLAKNGEILASIAHRRVREYPASGGPSSCCRAIDAAPLLALVRPLVQATGLSGIAMFEFKCGSDGAPRLLECNPRVWGTYPLTRAAGTNFTVLWACAALGQPLPPYLRPRPVKMVYYPADAAAMLGYFRRGRLGRGLGFFADFLDPRVKNGLWQWRDPMPGLRYLAGLFGRKRS